MNTFHLTSGQGTVTHEGIIYINGHRFDGKPTTREVVAATTLCLSVRMVPDDKKCVGSLIIFDPKVI